jgi:hypothetical protein
VNHSEQRVSPLDEPLPIQTLGHPVYFILRAEPSAADDKHDSAIIALGEGLKNVERQGQAVLPPVNDFLLPLKKALVCKSNRRAGKNEDDNQQWKRTLHRQGQLIPHARKQLQVCTKMQRTKKGPSDESAESSLGREELRIYLTQSSEACWRRYECQQKTAIKCNKTVISREVLVLLTLK